MPDKNCSKCNVFFECTSEHAGCWCENIFINLDVLNELKKQYDNCLCPACLEGYSVKEEKK